MGADIELKRRKRRAPGESANSKFWELSSCCGWSSTQPRSAERPDALVSSRTLAEEDAFFPGLGYPLRDHFQAVGLEQGADAVGGVAIGKEQADGFAGTEVEGFVVNRDLARLGETKVGGDAFESIARSVFLDDEAQVAVGAFDAEVEEEGQEPVAGEVVVVEREDALDAGGVIGAGREIGAEEQIIGRAQETGEAREDELRLEIGDHAEERDEAGVGGIDLAVEDGGQVVGGGEVAHERVTIRGGQGGEGGGAGREDHGGADIGRGVGDLAAGLAQQLEETGVLLTATAAEADEVDGGRGDVFGGGGEAEVIGRRAIGIGARGGEGLVEGEPFLGLFDAVVVEFVIDLARAEGVEQIAPDILRELAGMDGYGGNR